MLAGNLIDAPLYRFADAEIIPVDGQEFIGMAAADVGLVDGIKSFDTLLTDLKQSSVAQSTNLMDNRNNDRFKLSGSTSTEISGDTEMAKKALTEADIAALAAGVQVTASAEPEQAVEANAGDAAADVSAAAEVGSVEQSSQNAAVGTFGFRTFVCHPLRFQEIRTSFFDCFKQ